MRRPAWLLGVLTLSTTSHKPTLLIIAALVALRLGIGWQFFKEGVDKVRDPKPFSAPFFSAAKGPLAPFYHRLVWDADGRARLDEGLTGEHWELYRDRVAAHYGFDDEQKEQAAGIIARHKASLAGFLSDNYDQIEEYQLQRERLIQEKTATDFRSVSMRSVASLRGQSDKRQAEWTGKLRGWLGAIDKVWKQVEGDLNDVATVDQSARGFLALSRTGRHFPDSILIDQVVRYFDVTIGVLLILGGLVRPATIAAALFLASVVASQWPGTPGAIPTYYQVNLMLGCLVLAATGAGQFAGLDFLFGKLRDWCCPPRTGNAE